MIARGFSLIQQRWRLLTFLCLFLITAFSLIPLPELPLVPGSDKTHHLLAYFLLAFPVALAQPRAWLLFILTFVVWGGVIELVQPYVNRHGEWLDLAANTTGLMAGVITGRLIQCLRY